MDIIAFSHNELDDKKPLVEEHFETNFEPKPTEPVDESCGNDEDNSLVSIESVKSLASSSVSDSPNGSHKASQHGSPLVRVGELSGSHKSHTGKSPAVPAGKSPAVPAGELEQAPDRYKMLHVST